MIFALCPHNTLSPHVTHMTHCGHALNSKQILCVAFNFCFFVCLFFASGSVLYSTSDVEHMYVATENYLLKYRRSDITMACIEILTSLFGLYFGVSSKVGCTFIKMIHIYKEILLVKDE